MTSLMYILRRLLGLRRRMEASTADYIQFRPVTKKLSYDSYTPNLRPKVQSPNVVGAYQKYPGIELIDEHAEFSSKKLAMAAEKKPFAIKVIVWALKQIIYNRALRVEGLDLQIDASSNFHALSGNLKSLNLKFRTLALEPLQITGGASMKVTGIDLKVIKILQHKLEAFKRPFRVEGTYVFTNNDFIASSAVRNIVQAILTATFSRLNLGAVKVTRVGIKGNRIIIDGQSDLLQRFSCSADLGLSNNGHVISLKSIKYGTQDGDFLFQHPWKVKAVLPNDMGAATWATIRGSYMGDHTRIDHLTIQNGLLKVSGFFVVSPRAPLIVTDIVKRGMIHYDVGEKISAIVAQVLEDALKLW
eukprot:CAMPEP_0171469488 /NCGR_PEP_ID=MMETSP0945-20130129/11318_1 /TAXON_ID=109269 /ORGANISM="Vaucheria litorea, Strain CCMP2940" /LENGTH=358 /DNA_ID=CAMNT_0011998649 /DNA_START=308 /DNA_END=1385 /DNA_ORIENTATION=-